MSSTQNPPSIVVDPLGLVGKTIADKYLVERAAGEGGFAVVYRATHLIWKRPVAIKLFTGLSGAPEEQRDELQHAFINEGALLTELSSQTASIVQARDIGSLTTDDGVWMPYMVLEWLDGQPLDLFLEAERAEGKPPWSLKEALRLLTPVMLALDVAHGRGVAHRDVKPGNLFVLKGDARSEEATVKILDFGVAKMVSDTSGMKAALAKTGKNLTSFTPQYGAPEQFSRQYGATGPWTDVFALGLIFTELVTGKTALEGDDIAQLAFACTSEQKRPTPRGLGAVVPDAVEDVLLRAVATDPTKRYERAGELLSALEEAIGLTFSTGPRASTPISLRASPLDATVRAETPTTSTGSTTLASVTPPAGTIGMRSAALLALGGALVAGLVVFGAISLSRSEKPAAAASASPEVSASVSPPAPPCPQDMVEIPAGQLFLGSDRADALDNEKPVHNARIDSFCIDRTEVTMRAYKTCSDAGKCLPASRENRWGGFDKLPESARQAYNEACNANDPEVRGDHPVNCVDWAQARRYCEAQGKRLPTEGEWEYATRGPDGRVYPWGNEEPTAEHLNACGRECIAWHQSKGIEPDGDPLYDDDDKFPLTAPVGSFPKGSSRFGPRDVAGNVWEWVADWYGPYTPEDQANPQGPREGAERVMRGGAFNGSYATWLRPSFRYKQDPNARSWGIGFRCAALPKTPVSSKQGDGRQN